MLVIRKTSTVTEIVDDEEVERQVVALDSLEGVIKNVTAETVQFQYDDELIPVKRDKVEGLIYFHSAGGRLPDPVCRVSDADGCAWMVKSLALADGGISLETIAGVKARVDLDSVRKFDFSAGKIAYLSDLEPLNVEWTSDIPLAKPLESERLLYLPRRDRGFLKGSKLKLVTTDEKGHVAPREYEKGLAIHSRTLIEYNLPGEFQHFLAEAGIDASVRDAGGHVRLVISGDGRELFSRDVSADETEPISIELPVAGVRRLSILVDFGQRLGTGDHLNLCNARVTK